MIQYPIAHKGFHVKCETSTFCGAGGVEGGGAGAIAPHVPPFLVEWMKPDVNVFYSKIITNNVICKVIENHHPMPISLPFLLHL